MNRNAVGGKCSYLLSKNGMWERGEHAGCELLTRRTLSDTNVSPQGLDERLGEWKVYVPIYYYRKRGSGSIVNPNSVSVESVPIYYL